jgi:hypothetical protein
MGWRFRKSIKIGKNTRINLGKHGYSVSTGVKGARVTVNNKGKVTRTVGIPGTGIYNTKQYDLNKNKKSASNKINSSYRIGINDILTVDERKSIKIPFKIKLMLFLSIATIVAGFAFVPLFVLALLFAIITLGMMLFSKDYRYSLKIGMADTSLKNGNIADAIRWTRSAMKTKPNDIVAQKILNELM